MLLTFIVLFHQALRPGQSGERTERDLQPRSAKGSFGARGTGGEELLLLLLLIMTSTIMMTILMMTKRKRGW